MLNLRLRDEFLGKQMPTTAISLRTRDNTGAAQQDPNKILDITYPTADIQNALHAISDKRKNRPIVLKGDRGRGKSHIMAVMHHAIQSPDKIEAWAVDWGNRVGVTSLAELKLQRGYIAISEPVHNHEYPFLWDLLFDKHPNGQLFRGRFQQMKVPYPPRSLMEDMFQSQPIALILDEFQTWFDTLTDDIGTIEKRREKALNFIQNLSEISVERPGLLIFVISVLSNDTEAFKQVHRNSPVVIDFSGPSAKKDRQNLILHRLFINRENISRNEIANLISSYASERFRLLFSHISESERDRIYNEVIDGWPFSPELLDLLQDQILMTQAAQDTRDLIKVLASVYYSRGENVPLITPADFLVDEDYGGVQILLDSIATKGEQADLREIAQRNLDYIKTLDVNIPDAREMISALWMRSMSPFKGAGGTRREIQLDITRNFLRDDNQFSNELSLLIDNISNIHGEEDLDGRLRLEQGENAKTKVRATARNNKLWDASSSARFGYQKAYPGKDIEHLRKFLRHMFVPDTLEPLTRVIVLGPNWDQEPWSEVEEIDHPENWDRPVLIILPLPPDNSRENAILGDWLVTHVPVKRNVARFLLPKLASKSIFEDEELKHIARCHYLTSIEWTHDSKYNALKGGFERQLRELLNMRYDRFAILRTWDYQHPDLCIFDLERVEARGKDLPSAVEKKIHEELFDQAEFEKRVLKFAKESKCMEGLLKDIIEPPPPNAGDVIPYLGDSAIYEEVLKIAASGKIFVNVDDTWIQLPDHIDKEQAIKYIQKKAFRTGRDMHQVQLGLPSAVGGTTVTGPRQSTPLEIAIQPIRPKDQDTISGNNSTEGTVIAEAGENRPIQPIPETRSPITRRTEEPVIGINLLGKLEQWQVSSETTLDVARIELKNVTVFQLKQILQHLPPSIRASLEITQSEGEERC
mgnify:CR=1 FL=1